MFSMTSTDVNARERQLRRYVPMGKSGPKSAFSYGDRVQPRRNAPVDYAVPRTFSAKTAVGTVVEEIDSQTVRVKWDGCPAAAKGSVLHVDRIERIPTAPKAKAKRR